MSDATLDLQSFLTNTGAITAYKDYLRLQDYLVFLEDTIKSLNKRVSELQASLDQAQEKISQLEEEKRELINR